MPKCDGADFTYSETAPLFFTGPSRLVVVKKGDFDPIETEVIDVRINYLHFPNKIPRPQYGLSTLKCPVCFAKLILHG